MSQNCLSCLVLFLCRQNFYFADFRLSRRFLMDENGERRRRYLMNTSARKVIGTRTCFEAGKAVTSTHEEYGLECFSASGGDALRSALYAVRLVTVWSALGVSLYDCHNSLSFFRISLSLSFSAFHFASFFIHADFLYDDAVHATDRCNLSFRMIQIARTLASFIVSQ